MSSAPRLNVVAPAAGLALLALGAGFFFMTRGQESSTAAPKLSAQALVKRAAAKGNTPKAFKKRTAPPRKPVKPARPPAAPAVTNGLPASVASALERNKVVVVSLYAPDLPLDDMALREARVGAASVGAGFVALNVLNESQSRPLAEMLGVVEDPAVLVFRRPGEMFVRLTGFADQQTVAQAARNAAL
jgi:thiol:disulfide interchange protein